MVTFGKRMRELRKQAGLTQESLAQRAGLGIGAIRDYEQERKKPSVGSLFKLADALGVSCEDFKDCINAAPEPPPAKKKRQSKK